MEISNQDIEDYELKPNFENVTNVTNNMTNVTEDYELKANLEDSGNCSTSDDDNEVTNEFENLIARATELITSSHPATSQDKVKDTTSMLEAALENDFIMG